MRLSRPIDGPFDARLTWIADLSLNPHAYPRPVLEHYAWVRAYMADGRHHLLVARARFELPIPRWVFVALGDRFFAGTTVPEAAHLIAEECGWTMDDLAEETGIRKWGSSYAQACTLVRVAISQEDRGDDEIYSWRAYRTRAERKALADIAER